MTGEIGKGLNMRCSKNVENAIAIANKINQDCQLTQNLNRARLDRLSWILLMIVTILFAWTSPLDTKAIASQASLVPSPSLQSEQSAEILTANTDPPAPEVQSSVLNDAVKRTSKTISALRILSAQPKEWTDGCLGLGNPDELCTQAITPGWQIVVTDGLRDWTYRTDDTGEAVRLEQLDGSGN